jgi:hypothetical protein
LDRARLTVLEQQRLADALLDCECIRDRRVRDQLLQTLRQDPVGQHVSIVRQDLDRADVIGILNAFSRHAGGLTALLSCIDLFEPGSVAAERLRALIERVEPDSLLSGEQRAVLEDILSSIICPDAEELYWRSVGDFGPAPTGTNHDLASLARDLGDVVSTGPVPPLLIFLELVASRTTGHRLVLQGWIDQQATQWNIDPGELARHRSASTDRAVAQARSYLVVKLESYGADPDQYLLSTWFEHAGGSKPLRQNDEPIAVEDLAGIIDYLTTRDTEVTRDAASRLTVEMVLPRQLINRDVDQWPIAPAGFERPVGIQHPIVVRSLERLHDRALHREWRRKWGWLKENGSDPRMTVAGTHWISRPAEVNPQQLMIQLMADDPPVCIMMAFAPPDANDLGSDEFAAGVHSGAPAILWCRDSQAAAGFESEMRELLDGHGLLMLPELIHRYRQRAHFPDASPQHLGRHLTLLWDDFDRLPEELEASLLAPTRGSR